MLPIRLSRQFTHELAFNIGTATHFDGMTLEDLEVFFLQMGVDREDLDLLYETEIVPMIEAIERAAPRLKSAGLKTFNDLIGREMEEIVERLGLNVLVEERDFYPAEGT